MQLQYNKLFYEVIDHKSEFGKFSESTLIYISSCACSNGRSIYIFQELVHDCTQTPGTSGENLELK